MNTNPNTTYTDPDNKRQYKVIGLGKVPNTSRKIWINRKPYYYYHWYTIIKFLDNNERSKLFHDYNGKIYDKNKL